MATALVYRWRRSVPGREKEGMDVVREVDAFADRMIAEGRATSKEWINVWTDVWANILLIRGEPGG